MEILKCKIWSRRFWATARDSAFLANSQVMIMLTSKCHTLTTNVIGSLCTLVSGFILVATDEALPNPHPLSELLLWVTDQLCNWRMMGSLVNVFSQLIYALGKEIKAPILPYPRNKSESSVCKLLLNQKNLLDFLNISTFSPWSQDSLSFSYSLPLEKYWSRMCGCLQNPVLGVRHPRSWGLNVLRLGVVCLGHILLLQNQGRNNPRC